MQMVICVRPIVFFIFILFCLVGFYVGVLDLSLCAAEKRDPQGLALHHYKWRQPADDIPGAIALTERQVVYFKGWLRTSMHGIHFKLYLLPFYDIINVTNIFIYKKEDDMHNLLVQLFFSILVTHLDQG